MEDSEVSDRTAGRAEQETRRCRRITFFIRMLRLSEAFLTKGDFLESVEESLSLRFIWRHEHKINTPGWRHLHWVRSSGSSAYPADVLALRARGEGLGADDGVAPHEGVLLVDVGSALLGPDGGAVVVRQHWVHAGLLVDLIEEKVP